MTLLRAPDGNARLTLPTGECKVCAKAFIKMNSMQVVCGLSCAKRVPVIARNTLKAEAKAAKEDFKKRKEALKPRSKWLKEAQAAFNAWIRYRDGGMPCISCGRFHKGYYDAGHYLTVGARPELRFDEANCHKQCVPCNQFLHGNLILYRQALIRRIGQVEVDRLEGPTAPKHYDVDDLKALIAYYRARVREGDAISP